MEELYPLIYILIFIALIYIKIRSFQRQNEEMMREIKALKEILLGFIEKIDSLEKRENRDRS